MEPDREPIRSCAPELPGCDPLSLTRPTFNHTTDRYMYSRFPKTLCIVLIATVCAPAFRPLVAQAPPKPTVRVGSVRETLDGFEQRGGPAPYLLRVHDKYPRAKLDSLLAGLEHIVFTGRTEYLRMQAAGALTVAGEGDHALPDAVDRVVSIYRRSSDVLVREIILRNMMRQHDRPRAIAFLKTVALEEPSRDGVYGAPTSAVGTLRYMGTEGRSALVELRDSGRVHDPNARAAIQWFLTHPGQ
jgi:hypothetical protein